jgi:hypothetical protein
MIKTEIKANDLYTVDFDDFPLDDLQKSCPMIEQLVNQLIDENNFSPSIDTGSKTTKHFNRYNIFHYNAPGVFYLYEKLYDVTKNLTDLEKTPYMIQCWINVYKYNDFISWHSHFPKESNALHGFFCINCEPSVTSYRFRDGSQYDVESKNGRLVIGSSGNDLHRTYPWPHKDRDRITIAFDIVPLNKLDDDPNSNRSWLPFKHISEMIPDYK